jgi:hypothetical protein
LTFLRRSGSDRHRRARNDFWENCNGRMKRFGSPSGILRRFQSPASRRMQSRCRRSLRSDRARAWGSRSGSGAKSFIARPISNTSRKHTMTENMVLEPHLRQHVELRAPIISCNWGRTERGRGAPQKDTKKSSGGECFGIS